MHPFNSPIHPFLSSMYPFNSPIHSFLSFVHPFIYFPILHIQEQIRTKQLEDSINKTDELIYQMIPKQIADKLRNGETPLNTCQVSKIVSLE